MWNMKVMVIPIVIGTRTGGHGNNGTSGDYTNYSIFQDTEKSPGDLRKLAATQTPGKNHQLTLM